MELKNFFNQIDHQARSKEIALEAENAKKQVYLETTINFAKKLTAVVEKYIPEFEKRGFRCENKVINLPYWHFEVSNPKGARVKVAIVTGYQQDYEIAFYNQDERINATFKISDSFDKIKVELELQSLFQKLV